MKKIVLAMAAVSALAIGVPAAAQPSGGYFNSNADIRIDQLRARIQAGVQQGSISRQEAQSLRMQLRQLADLERHYRAGGLTAQERADLQQRTRALRQQIRTAEGGAGGYDDDRWDDRDGRRCPPGLERRNNGCVPPGQVGRDGRWEDRRDDRDDRWEDRRDDRDDRWDDRGDDDGRWQGRIDRNRDGYDDRDLNRDGRIDRNERRIADDHDERGNGGILDRLIGGGGLRVGQRVSGNLGAVPYELRNHYRDGNGVYYRADRRNVYQIDARTDVVLQIYPLNR